MANINLKQSLSIAVQIGGKEVVINEEPEDPLNLPEDRSSFMKEVTLDTEDINEFGGTIDVRYLPNLRSIKDRIKSCISCSEYECPIIKQRLDRHMIQHHSSSSNRQRDSQSGNSSYLSENSSLMSDGQTSTTDILRDAKKYRKLLHNEILEWAKEIPIYPDQSIESKKQNLVNKFIDKINDMFTDIYNDNYSFILRNRAESVLNSLPGLDKERMLKIELKDDLLQRISRLNKKFIRNSFKNKERNFPEKPEVREVATSTLIDKLLDSNKRQNISTNTVQEYYNEVLGSGPIDDRVKINKKKGTTVNAEVQVRNSVANALKIKDNLQNEEDEFKEIKTLFKQKVLDWMKNIMENTNYKFVNTNVDKNFICNILWEQLKEFLIKKDPARSDRLVLKVKIFDMIDSLPLSTSALDPIYRDTIANDLNNRLQSIQSKKQSAIDSVNYKASLNIKETLKNRSLKNLTKIPSIKTFDLNNLLKVTQVKNFQSRLLITNKKDLPQLAGTLSVFKSEYETRSKSKTTCKRKAPVSNEILKLNSSEIMYINKIVEIIDTWLDTLPKEFKNIEKKYDNIKYLAREIYDQIKLEEEGEITVFESDKFKYFIIRKWLNRFDFFDASSNSKPYIDRLVKELKDIPKIYLEVPMDPVISCCESSPETLEPEMIMKNLILKYLEYNYTEDDEDKRYLFTHLLKSELPNLCLPSRKEVYDSLEQYVSGGALSFKKLDKELQYIMLISDFLNEIPLSDSFSNKKRIEFINNIAQNIYVTEKNNANTTDLQVIIKKFIEELPITILTEYNENVNVIIDDLTQNIVRSRNSKSCCQFSSSNKVNSTVDSKNLSDFFESFIRDNHKSLLESDTKLEACSLRLVRELNKLIAEKPDAFDKNEVYKRLANKSLLGGETVRRFSLELNYAKEISDWLNNLPLIHIQTESDAEMRTLKIGELVHKVCEYQEAKKIEPHNPNVTAYFTDYLKKWVLSFPLDSRKEMVMPVIIQQLLNRIDRVNKEQIKKKESSDQPKYNRNIICKSPVPCCSYGTNEPKKKSDPAKAIVETIDIWCSNLPLEGDTNDGTELKENIATKLYQKLDEINANPLYYENEDLYQDTLAQEISNILDSAPNTQMLKNKEALIQNLLKDIMDNKKVINLKTSGDKYKQDLENTISMSIPNPLPTYKYDPGFEIYKDKLAAMFILDNFDYSHNAVKLKYEKRLREKINQHFKNAQNRTAAQLSQEQLYNELYSSLFRVPIPNEEFIADEVEQIKTRCEIEIWFEKLPLNEARDLDEFLERDKILTMLAKRLHEIEKIDVDTEEKMHKEIVKCLRKLPLKPGKEVFVDQFASELQARLKSTFAMRQCVTQVDVTKLIDKIQPYSAPNYETHTQTPIPRCCQISPIQSKKPADIIIDMVEKWCTDLPIPANTQEEIENVKMFKDNMVIKIIIKISELNMNPEIFNNNNLYDNLLDDELESIFATLPSCCGYVQNRNQLKRQLINAINSVKPLIIEENTRYKYKQELKAVVSDILEKPNELNENSVDVANDIKNDIVDNFVIYTYYRDDIDGKQMYKMMINDSVAKYIRTGNQRVENYTSDPLLKSNQLVCELSKVPSPGENALMDEVEEIRMKHEVTEFLQELPLNFNDETVSIKNQIKSTLARRLSDLEKSGHSNEIEQKMKDEVRKCLRKIDESIDTAKIESFIEKLRNSEALRKSHPPQIFYENDRNNETFVTPPIYNSFQTPIPYQSDPGMSFVENNAQNEEDDQWMSLLPITPQNYNQTFDNNDLLMHQINIPNYGTPQADFQDFEQGMNSFPNNLQEIGALNKRTSNDYRSYNSLTMHPNEDTLTPMQNSYKRNQISNDETRDFEAGIRITSTPLQGDLQDGSMKCQFYGRTQNKSLSQQTYRRPNQASNNPATSYQPLQNQSYEKQRFDNFRQNGSQYQNDFTELPTTPDRFYPTQQSNSQNKSISPIESTARQFEFNQISLQKQQYRGTTMDNQMRYPRNQSNSHFNTPTPGSSNNSQVPSIAIPGSFRPPCLLPSATNNQKSICKPCRRSSTAMLDTESCLRKIVKNQKLNSLENQLYADDENCACFKKRRNQPMQCIKKHCKICNNLNYFSTVSTCRYPGFYYY